MYKKKNIFLFFVSLIIIVIIQSSWNLNYGDWSQTDWSGGISSEYAVDPEDQVGWTYFESSDETVEYSIPGEISVAAATEWKEYGINGDFDDGTFDNIWTNNNGALNFIGDATGALSSEYRLNIGDSFSNSAADPFILYNDSLEQYVLYYSYYDGTSWNIAYRTSDDGKTNFSDSTVISALNPDPDTTDTAYWDVRTPFVKELTSGGYRMYYSVYNGTYWEIYTDDSVDGTDTWGGPVDLNMAVDATDQAYAPFVFDIPDNGGVRIYYGRYFFNLWQIIYKDTTDTDGLTGWGEPNFIGVGRNFTYQAQSCYMVQLINGTYRMYFDWFNSSYYGIYYVESTDGKDGWEAPVLISDATSTTNPLGPFLISYPDNTFRLYYSLWTTSTDTAQTGYWDIVYRDQQPGPKYATSGSYESNAFDFGEDPEYSILEWEDTLPTDTEVKFQIATADWPADSVDPFDETQVTWDFVGPDGKSTTYYETTDEGIWSGHTGDRYCKYKIYFSSTDDDVTPLVTSVTISTVRSVVSSPFNSGNNYVSYKALDWGEDIPVILENGVWNFDFEDSTEYTFGDATYIGVKNGAAQLIPSDYLVDASDDFSGNDLNTRKWYVYNSGSGTVLQDNGVVTQTVGGGTTPSEGEAQLIHSMRLFGNFDIQVDFNPLTSFPYPSSTYLSVVYPSIEPVQFGEVRVGTFYDTSTSGYRSGYYNGLYWTYSYLAAVSTTNIKFRITRSGSSCATYYWNDQTSSWTNVQSVTVPTAECFVRLGISNESSTGNLQVEWDNFIVNSATNIVYEELSAAPQTLDTQTFKPEGLYQWTGMEETSVIFATDTLRYQLSDDDGTTWYYWSGSSWIEGENEDEFSDIDTVNAHIDTFPVTDDGIKVRIQMRSLDRWLTPTLDNLQLNYTFKRNTDLRLQLRSAPDNGGIPGTWSEWLGPVSSKDFYTLPGAIETINSEHSDGVDDQWIQWRAFYVGPEADNMPVLEDVLVRYGLAPSTPSIITPLDGAVDVSTSVPLIWEPSTGAVPITYRLQIDDNPDFLTPLIDEEDIDTIPYYPNLEVATTYYWRVRSMNVAGQSSWSSSSSFTTQTTGETPSIPTLLSPSHGTVDMELPITLTWNKTNGTTPVTYRVQVSDTEDFTNLLLDYSEVDNYSYTITELNTDSVLFYWRVSASNPYGQSSWTFTRQFALKYNVEQPQPVDHVTPQKCFISRIFGNK